MNEWMNDCALCLCFLSTVISLLYISWNHVTCYCTYSVLAWSFWGLITLTLQLDLLAISPAPQSLSLIYIEYIESNLNQKSNLVCVHTLDPMIPTINSDQQQSMWKTFIHICCLCWVQNCKVNFANQGPITLDFFKIQHIKKLNQIRISPMRWPWKDSSWLNDKCHSIN